ncbi:hypothetical protein NLM24_13325 [Nocardia zapadnayensis]|uniref:hypothetical protein n=1 Tax=Nocardia rhamnosiphila TaxID=426716 RepID=UPI0022486103|nr:hypothetical protein [Nocardia zapadnayensis]MCX0271672.1 hypothetical protein [Nocardia zapadnayensis]
MGKILPLPVRQPIDRAVAMEYWHASRLNDRTLLERIAAGLCGLHDTYPTTSQADLPIHGYSQPDQAAP